MGAPVTEEEKKNKELSKKIDNDIRKEKRQNKMEVKLLLLGAGEAGKSTFARQMQILYLDGFSEEERVAQKPVIFCNILDSAQKLSAAVMEKFDDLDYDADMEGPGTVANIDLTEDIELTPELVKYVKNIWDHPATQEAYTRSSEFQLNDTAEYFFTEIDRIAQRDYVPSDTDMLRLRKKTTGIIETKFLVEELNFRMVDVGGQRNERKKWIHCFEDVTAIIFLISLSEFDCVLEEDESTNRMHESLELFNNIINNEWFEDMPILLFMNKIDLFERKIQKVDLKVCFTSYKDGCDQDKALQYIQMRFERKNKTPDRNIYSYVTCATDTENAKKVFNSVKHIILKDILAATGFAA